MKPLVVAIVIPSLNEETTLRDTCRSLGFHKLKSPPSDAFLFIVDNGSTDKTLEVAQEIQRNSPQGSIVIGQEKERGYVPPRHTGNMLVKAFTESKGLDPSRILLLQADADTLYAEGYVDQMRKASQTVGPNFLLEGLAEFPSEFRSSFPEYVERCIEVDMRVSSILSLSEKSDLICTDAVSGYRLSDYLAWGGHLREYRSGGDEIYAETTRLYMRAQGHGAQKISASGALAYPSQRKLMSCPAEEFATAGFPREDSWKAAWERQHKDPITLDNFGAYLGYPTILHAIKLRERHMVALFGVLPLHVARALGRTPTLPALLDLEVIAASLPAHNLETLSNCPGAFIADILNLVDHQGDLISAVLKGLAPMVD